MCIVCVLLDKEKITKIEALTAYSEQVLVAKDATEMGHITDKYAELKEELDTIDKLLDIE